MLSRRAFLLSALAASTASTLARAQPAPQTGASSAQPTLLRIERRSIEVNGKPASVLGIRQPDGTFGIRTQVGNRFRVRVENTLNEAEPDPLARSHAAMAAGRRSRRLRTADCAGRGVPTTTSRCVSAGRSGCIPTRDFRSSC